MSLKCITELFWNTWGSGLVSNTSWGEISALADSCYAVFNFANIVHQIFHYKHLPLDRNLSMTVSILKMTNGWIPLSCLNFRVLVLYTLADSHTEGQRNGFVSFSWCSFPTVSRQKIYKVLFFKITCSDGWLLKGCCWECRGVSLKFLRRNKSRPLAMVWALLMTTYFCFPWYFWSVNFGVSGEAGWHSTLRPRGADSQGRHFHLTSPAGSYNQRKSE